MSTSSQNSWDVDLECRLVGALGIFTWVTFRVRAEPVDVTRFALEDAHFAGYETRGSRPPHHIELSRYPLQ
jgi:hypothetical protein